MRNIMKLESVTFNAVREIAAEDGDRIAENLIRYPIPHRHSDYI